MKTLFSILIILTIVLNSYSQNRVEVRYDYDASGNAIFNAQNYGEIPVYLVLNFSFLDYASFSEDLPYIKRINPGSNQLFTILKEPDQPSPKFGIEFKIYNSHPSPETDSHFPYLIPAKQGTTVIIADNKPALTSFVGFFLKQSDEVCAARKGIVVNLFEDFDPAILSENKPSQNFVYILHDDGTMGEYSNFSYKGIDCEIGQKVIPGQKLGKAATGLNARSFIVFALTHSNRFSGGNIFLVPEFYIDESKISQLSVSEEYKVVHPEKVVVKELSRKERKTLIK